MRTRIMSAAATALLVLTACGGSPAPADDPVPVGPEPIVVSPATPGNASGYVDRAKGVADQLDQRNADVEGMTP